MKVKSTELVGFKRLKTDKISGILFIGKNRLMCGIYSRHVAPASRLPSPDYQNLN